MRIDASQGFIELAAARVSQTDRALSDSYSFVLNVRAHIRGFTAGTQVWVQRTDWDAFMKAMELLERDRKGTATIEAADPDELRLTFRVLDRAGHIGIDGSIGVRDADQVLLSFSAIEMDAGKLAQLVAELHELTREVQHPAFAFLATRA